MTKASAIPLRWLSESQQQQLGKKLADLLTPVLNEWRGAGGAKVSLRYAPAIGAPKVGSAYQLQLDGGPATTWLVSNDTLRQVLLLPGGTLVHAEEGSMLVRLEHDVFEGMSLAMARRAGGVEPSFKKINHGGVVQKAMQRAQHCFELILEGLHPVAWLILEPWLVDFMVPKSSYPTAHLTSRRVAIGDEQVELHVELGKVDVPYKDLKKLAVGDVLVLSTPISAAVTLSNTKGQSILKGNLGRHEGKLAVRISDFHTMGHAPAQKSKRSA